MHLRNLFTLPKISILAAFVVLICWVGTFILRRDYAALDAATALRDTAGAQSEVTTPAASSPPAPSKEQATARTNGIFRTASTRWNQPISEEPFAQFQDWVERYRRAAPANRAALEVEGVALAKARRDALKSLIQSDPERALELTAPLAVRRELPTAVAELLEERLSGRGKLAVLAALPEPGKENEVVPTFRTATIGARTLEAFVYGRRLGEPTRNNIPLNGIAVENFFAVNANALRILEREEAAEAKAAIVATEAICAVSGLPSTVINEEVAADIGGQTVFLCRPDHAVELNDRIVAAESGPPSPDGSGAPDASTWTEGQKKLIVIRVDFPDLVGVPLADSTAISMIQGLNNFYTEMSYGRAGFFTNGAGSDFTPTFRMPQPAAYYGTNNYYDQLRADAKSAATTAGYTISSYNFDIICMGAVPGWGWSGLGYVGAAGSWLRSSFSTGVAGHEIGHNYGLNHANYWNTSGQSVVGTGTSGEYGDSFDTMGAASAGNNHFNARYKSYLNWLTANDVVTATTNGVYRIYAHDDPNSYGARGLRIVKNSATNYWVEFRQKFTGNKWLMNGGGLRWAQSGNQKSQLLDITPGSTDGKSDSGIVIGRTFSDKVSGIHITPVGKGGTSPESLDVVVNLGMFPSDIAPTVDLTASATNAGTGVTLNFTVAASDPDGDSLAYYWDFGDGNFGTNGPTASKSWSSAGEYLVRCVVSDMKGGVASKWVVVTIGSPTTYRISGQIATTGGPVEGVRVYVSTTRMAYTDSEGNYSIVGLPAGSYTVNASLENYSFAPNGFTNPVVVGPNQTAVNFLATSSSSTPPTITSQPLSQGVNPGANATFSVAATGTTPMYYQWRFNGVNIAGASSSSYTKNNVQATNAGNYSVVVSNTVGTATSASAVLTVNSPPAITSQPQSQTVIAGANVTFSVTATGSTPLSYQWHLNGTNIAGATSSSFTRNNAQPIHAGNYTAVVTNSLGSVTSSPASLTVNFTLNASTTAGGTLTKNPDQPSYAPNTVVTLTASPVSIFSFTGWSGDASGTNNPLMLTMTTNLNVVAEFASPVADLIVDNPQATFTGTWSTDTTATDKYGSDYHIAGTTQSGTPTATATFTPNITSGGRYDVLVWFPTITRGLADAQFLVSSSDGDLTVGVDEFTGSSGWRLLASGKLFAQGTNGLVRLSNNNGQTSKNVVADAVRWVYSTNQDGVPPTLLTQPTNEAVMAGRSASFSVQASGSQPMTFQWCFNGSSIAGATNSSFVLTNVLPGNAGTYDVTLSNVVGTIISSPATLLVSVPPTFNSMLVLSNGVLQLTLTGTAGDRYAIQATTNLIDWTAVTTLTNMTGTVLWSDPIVTGISRRFYRAQLLP